MDGKPGGKTRSEKKMGKKHCGVNNNNQKTKS